MSLQMRLHLTHRVPLTSGIFISYHHRDAEYKWRLSRYLEDCTWLANKSVDAGDIDPGLDDVRTRRRIADHFLRDAQVTIVLVGAGSAFRKFVDWEIMETLEVAKGRRRPDGKVEYGGLVGVVLPYLSPFTHFDDRVAEILPPRLADNVASGYAKIYPWARIVNDTDDYAALCRAIHAATRRSRLRPETIRNTRQELTDDIAGRPLKHSGEVVSRRELANMRRLDMIWYQVLLTSRQVEQGHRAKIRDEFIENCWSSSTESSFYGGEMTSLGEGYCLLERTMEGGHALALYFPPASVTPCWPLIKRYRGRPCNAPASGYALAFGETVSPDLFTPAVAYGFVGNGS